MNLKFSALVAMFQHSVMLNLGKISNPATGKVERDMSQAKMAIDILEMLKEKTKGNLDSEEEKMLTTVLADSQLNYLAEEKKPPDAAPPAEEPKKEDNPENSAQENTRPADEPADPEKK